MRVGNINTNIQCLICYNDDWDYFAKVKHIIKSFELTICKKCGLVIQNPPLSNEFLVSYYQNDYVEKNYGNNLETIYKNMLYPSEARLSFLKNNNYLEKLNKVLEIGPGAGSMMHLLSDSGIDVVGIERSLDEVYADVVTVKLTDNPPLLSRPFNRIFGGSLTRRRVCIRKDASVSE